MIQAAAHMATRVAILQSACEHLIQGRAGNNAELPEPGDGAGQPPG